MTDFKIFTPATFFEKSDAPQGQRRRIAGLVTTDSRDRQAEQILQDGLDFTDFLGPYGWFNDNHSKSMTDVLGYPTAVQFFTKGSALPDGTTCPANGHWAEGYLLEGMKKADEVWELAKALQNTPRRLGFSIEGKVEKRLDEDRRVIARARVAAVAITHCPVNTDTGMRALVKALDVSSDNASAIVPESLEGVSSEAKRKKRLVDLVRSKYPTISDESVSRILSLAEFVRKNN
jgi:hypothetical protein